MMPFYLTFSFCTMFRTSSLMRLLSNLCCCSNHEHFVSLRKEKMNVKFQFVQIILKLPKFLTNFGNSSIVSHLQPVSLYFMTFEIAFRTIISIFSTQLSQSMSIHGWLHLWVTPGLIISCVSPWLASNKLFAVLWWRSNYFSEEKKS